MRITLAYATTFNSRGQVILSGIPLTEPPGQMVSDSDYKVLRSREVRPGEWQHDYLDRETGQRLRAEVRSVKPRPF